MTKNKEIYAVLKNGVLMESDTWYPRNEWCLVHKSGQVFPLSTYKVIVKDVDHYIIEGAEYSKNDFFIKSQADAAKIMRDGAVIKSDDDGNKLESPDDEVFKDVGKFPNPNDGSYKPFTRCVINAIKQDGKIVPITKKQQQRRTSIVRKLKTTSFTTGDKEIGIDDAIFLLSTFNIEITDILNEKYI